jgi:predicted nucleotidyltransferase
LTKRYPDEKKDFYYKCTEVFTREKFAEIEGIYTSGKIHASSDIDIAIISPDFGKDRFEEGKLLMQIAWRVDPRIEAVPISSESYEKDTWIPLIYEIRQKGIVAG